MSFTASAAEVRQAEKIAADSGIAEYSLMFSAGRQAADMINFHYPDAVRFVVLCGSGNNGGDALVAAAQLFLRYRREVVVYTVKPLNKLTGCAAFAAAELPEAVPVFEGHIPQTGEFRSGDVIVDGLLGIGFSGGNLRPEMKEFIRNANLSHCPVAALDLPSGMNGDTGECSPDGVINADLTVTFGMVKTGLFSGEGSRLRGKLRLADIGLQKNGNSGLEIFTNVDAVSAVKTPVFDCHKNSRGRVLVWGGSQRYPGAPVLTAEAALRCGSGMVRLVSCGGGTANLPSSVIFHRILNGSDAGVEVSQFFSCSDVLAAGCGWGDETPAAALDNLWNFPGTLILDADALNMFSCNIDRWKKHRRTIITPHPGEAARLAKALHLPEALPRRETALALAEKLQAVTLLKGRDSIIASPDGRWVINSSGDSSLATAGSGDVLAGVIAAVAGSGMPPFDAACLGCYIHGAAGETAGTGVIADELPGFAGTILQKLRGNRIF